MSSINLPSELVCALVSSIMILLNIQLNKMKVNSAIDQKKVDKIENDIVRVHTLKRILDSNDLGNKRKYLRWNHERARQIIESDYWSPIAPLFNDRTFERTFRVTKQIANVN